MIEMLGNYLVALSAEEEVCVRLQDMISRLIFPIYAVSEPFQAVCSVLDHLGCHALHLLSALGAVQHFTPILYVVPLVMTLFTVIL